jgi:hypothetical protein
MFPLFEYGHRGTDVMVSKVFSPFFCEKCAFSVRNTANWAAAKLGSKKWFVRNTPKFAKTPKIVIRALIQV